jgi:hypothetical protein
MSPSTRPAGTYEDPFVPLGLIVAGLIALCLAVLYPFQRLLWGLSPTDLLSGGFSLSAETVVVAACFLCFAGVATLYGVVLLLLRL